MAYAGAEFAAKVVRALRGETGIVAPTFVHLDSDAASGAALKKEIGKDLEYFSAPVELGPQGVASIRPLGTLTPYEKTLVDAALPELQTNIDKVRALRFPPAATVSPPVSRVSPLSPHRSCNRVHPVERNKFKCSSSNATRRI